jgi:hypothetical protein
VADKLDLVDPHRDSGHGIGVCDVPAPGSSCSDPDAVIDGDRQIFYQVLAACGSAGANEGPF